MGQTGPLIYGSIFWQQMFNGLTLGAVYGLIAIGLVLLSFFGVSSFSLLIFGTLVVTGVYGWVIERIAYRPLRNSTRLAPLISAIVCH